VTIPLVITLLAVFVAGTTAILAAALVLRDVRQTEAQFQRRVGNGFPIPESPAPEMLVRTATNWLDRRFYMLLEGSGSNLSAATALAVVAGMGMIGCVLAVVLLDSLLAGIIGLLAGGMLPLLWWTFQRSRRYKRMQKHLPGALDLLADGLHSGQTLEQTAEMVAVQGVSPLKEEFGYAVSLLRLGHSPVAVMERMARRIPLPEFKVFATAVMVHRHTGGNLARLAARLAASARDRQEFFGHLGSQTVAGRYSAIGLIITAILGLAVLAAARPRYVEFFYHHELGPTLMLTAGIFFLVGIVWMWRILRVRY